MKSTTAIRISTILLFATLATPNRLTAQHPRYRLVDLGTFGGPASSPVLLSEQGIVLGNAQLAMPFPPNSNPFACPFPVGSPNIAHAFELENGLLKDLGTLSGGYCSGDNAINRAGVIAGDSEVGEIDPIAGVRQMRAVIWRDGQIMDLGTLGGYESAAGGINNQGQVVGLALNAVPDPFSIFYVLAFGSSAGTQTRAFVWQNGVVHDLGTLGGPDAQAALINESGQVAGVSYINSTPNATTGIPTIDPFFWENGRIIDIGSLGGTFGFPLALNNGGQVAGNSNLAGDLVHHPFLWDHGQLTDLGTLGGDNGDANALNDLGEVVGDAFLSDNQTLHAVLWKHSTIADLGTLQGDSGSFAMSINSKAQVVGVSFAATTAHAFLWEKGSMVNLNDLIPPNSALRLVFGLLINDRGEIAGIGYPPGCNASDTDVCGHAFLLIPCKEGDNMCGA